VRLPGEAPADLARGVARSAAPDPERVSGGASVPTAPGRGSDRDPAWPRNVRAHGHVRFLRRERGWRDHRAPVTAGNERTRAWESGTDLYAGYVDALARATRRDIPVVMLEPLPD
jgi:deazaflavin-dependent oxidoreductase (nitroreductase family)